MNRRVLLILVVVLLVGGVVLSMRSRAPAPADDPNKVKILVAVADVPVGGFVRVEKDINWVDWSRGNVTPSMITSDTDKIEQYNGAVARRSIQSGEPIARNTLVKSTEGGFLSAVLSPGARAVSISVNATSGNAGFVFPGDHVDLLLTHRIQVSNADDNRAQRSVLASETFAENIRVVAVDQMLDNPDNKAVLAKTLTLEVTPKQAEKINVAVSLGTISVSLRSLGNTKASAAPATLKVGEVAPVAPVNPDAGDSFTQDSEVSKLIDTRGDGKTSVKVIRGNTAEQVDFLRNSP